MSVPKNNRRIAKNTFMLYCRMMVIMCVSIFSTRVLLQVLGVSDYGLVNLIGSIVMMFYFISGTMNTAISRFITYELGKKDFKRLKKIFNISQILFLFIVLILFILSETVVLWFFKTYIVISPERANAAFWFFQCSIGSFLLGVINIPYIALLIAHENMKCYAWISVFEAFVKLGIIYLLYLSSSDKLIFYGFLMLLVSIIHFLIYFVVCNIKYPESRYAYFFDKKMLKELVVFAGWNLWGAVSGLFSNVFINVLLNNYFGPIANAARGITNQVSAATTSFTNNFLVATNPQITKYFAADEKEQSYLLTMRASRFGFFLMFFISFPFFILCPFILDIWLSEAPNCTVPFIRLVLISLLIDSISYPLMTLAQASGRIALYQSVVGGTLLLNLPLTWIMFYFGAPPESFGFVAIFISVVCLLLRLILLRRCAGLPVYNFVRSVIFPVISTVFFALIIPLFVYLFLVAEKLTFVSSTLIGLLCALSTLSSVLMFGVYEDERILIFKFLKLKRNS